MRILIYIILIPLFAFCSAKQSKDSSKAENKQNNSIPSDKYWINQQYSECVKNDLPCECIGKVDIILYSFNPLSALEVVIYDKTFDPIEKQIIKSGNNDFYAIAEDTTKLFTIKIANDTMYINKDNSISKFVYFKKYEKIKDGETLISKFNIDCMRALIVSEEFGMDKDLNLLDNTMLDCNIGLGNINLIYNQGVCENKWIIETKENNYLIYKYVNSCAPKTYPIVIDKKLVYTVPMQRKL